MNGNAAADKIFKLLDEPLPQCGTNTKMEGDDIVFSDVSFAYEPEKPVLKVFLLRQKRVSLRLSSECPAVERVRRHL